jgi:hypothetical protein
MLLLSTLALGLNVYCDSTTFRIVRVYRPPPPWAVKVATPVDPVHAFASKLLPSGRVHLPTTRAPGIEAAFSSLTVTLPVME